MPRRKTPKQSKSNQARRNESHREAGPSRNPQERPRRPQRSEENNPERERRW